MKQAKYTAELPKRMYCYFRSYDGIGAPSFSKFAASAGITLADVERFRKKSEFERAYKECSEIRRDYLIDNALAKKQDASLTKFLLTAEFGMGGDTVNEEDKRLLLTLEVVGE